MHVLVVEHNPERARALAAVLHGAGHRAEVVTSGSAALVALARPTPPDLLLCEEHLPDMPAVELLAAVSRMGITPPSMLLGGDEKAARWLDAVRLGARDYVPLDPEGAYLATIAARVEAVRRRATERDRAQVLADALESTSAAVLLTDREGRIEHANAACRRLLGTPPVVDVAEGSLESATSASPTTLADVFALAGHPRVEADLFGAVATGGEWAGEVNVQRPDGETVPCIVTLSPIRRSGGRTEGLVLTLRDVSERVAMEDALRAANRRLAEQAARDGLTGLYNRAYFNEVLEREVARTLRYGGDCAVLMLDLDRFKDVNDERGHAAGDGVLAGVAAALGKGLRDGDVLARYGGDEFCVLLPSTSREPARLVAERLRSLVKDRPHGPPPGAHVTLSIGFANASDVPSATQGPADALLRLADALLFRAKGAGGDCVRGEGDRTPTSSTL